MRMRAVVTGIAVLVMLASTPGQAVAGRHAFAREARDAARRGDAAGIVEAARAAHRAMSSLAAEGETTMRMRMLGQEQSFASTFSMRLARPNRYRITWTGTTGPSAGKASPLTILCHGSATGWPFLSSGIETLLERREADALFARNFDHVDRYVMPLKSSA